jgi:hypothetical protein
MAKINEYPLERFTFGDDDYYDIDYWDGAVYQSAKIKGSTIKAAMSGGGSILAADGQVMPADRSQDLASFKLSLRDGVFTLGTVDADFGSIFQATKDSGNTYATIKTKTNDNAALILDINTADVTGAGNKTAFIQFRDAGVSKYIFGTNTDGVANFSDNSFFISSSAQLTDYIQAIDRDTESFVIGRQVGNPLNDNTKFLINNGNSFDTTELDNVLMLSSRDETKKWSVDKDMVMSATKAQSLELTATDRGLLLNRVTTAQMNGIVSPTTNEIVYNTDLNALYRYDGAAWVALSAGYGLVSVTDSSGIPTFYATFKDAVDAISGNGVVNIHSDLLIDDVSEMATISTNDTLTINGNGYTITHTCNTGDDFNLITGTTSASLYLNNIKILSNGTAGGNGIAVLFGDSFNFIQCDKLTIIEALNNDIAESTVIKGGNLTATNRYVLFGNSNSVVENANVIAKFGRSNFKNCNITINSGGSIGLSASEISGCTITCDSISSVPFNELSNNCKFWNNTITCTSGTNRVIEVENAGTSKHVNIQGNKIYNYGSGDAIYFQDLKTVVNNYIYSESGHCINFARVANKDNYYNLIDNTCITNATNKAAVRGSVTLTAFQNLSSLRLTAVNINASNTQPAIDISIAINKELELHDTKAIVANDTVDNVEISGDGTVYLYNLKMSKTGTGLNNTATLGNTTGSIDEYGNGQMQ